MSRQTAANESENTQSLDSIISEFQKKTEKLEKGQNVLFDFGNSISLLKYESQNIGYKHPLQVRFNRHTTIACLGNYFIKDDPSTHIDPAKRIFEKARVDVLGTHRIDFTFDDEFGIHLPSAENHTDLYIDLAQEYANGKIKRKYENIDVISDEKSVVKKLKEITRPKYFETNVVPFLESRPTALEMPRWKTNDSLLSGLKNAFFQKNRPRYFKFNIPKAYKWFVDATKDLECGSFVYVGGKEQAYMLGLARDEDGLPFMQGTYFTSTKPMFFFSNNYLGHMSKNDMEKPLYVESGNGMCNLANYRSEDAPSFKGKPFIFTAMRRNQNCKNTIFTIEPDVITGNLKEAVSHFRSTDFSEFEDIVKEYAAKIKTPTPDVKPLGKFFY